MSELDRPSAASASTVCAVTSADGGSTTSPKSQNGSLVTSREVLSASNAPQPPSLDCIPMSQRTARSSACAARPPGPAAPPGPGSVPGDLATRPQGEQALGRVVDVRVAVVVELERPRASRRQSRPAHLPVAGPVQLLVQHPFGRGPQRRVVAGQAG